MHLSDGERVRPFLEPEVEDVQAPYETGCARVHLARALLQAGDRTSATLELNAARALLEPLGAKPAIAQADSVTLG